MSSKAREIAQHFDSQGTPIMVSWTNHLSPCAVDGRSCCSKPCLGLALNRVCLDMHEYAECGLPLHSCMPVKCKVAT